MKLLRAMVVFLLLIYPNIVIAGDVTMEQFLAISMGMPYEKVVTILGPPDEELARSEVNHTVIAMYSWKG